MRIHTRTKVGGIIRDTSAVRIRADRRDRLRRRKRNDGEILGNCDEDTADIQHSDLRGALRGLPHRGYVQDRILRPGGDHGIVGPE